MLVWYCIFFNAYYLCICNESFHNYFDISRVHIFEDMFIFV